MDKLKDLKHTYQIAEAEANKSHAAFVKAREAVRDAWREFKTEYAEQSESGVDIPWCAKSGWWETKFTKEEQGHLEKHVRMGKFYRCFLGIEDDYASIGISQITADVGAVRGNVGDVRGNVRYIKGDVFEAVNGSVEEVRGDVRMLGGNINTSCDHGTNNFSGYINGYEWDYVFNPRYHSNSEIVGYIYERFGVKIDGRTKRSTLLDELKKLKKSHKKKGEMCDSYRH